jgi:hypothetical protein
MSEKVVSESVDITTLLNSQMDVLDGLRIRNLITYGDGPYDGPPSNTVLQ